MFSIDVIAAAPLAATATLASAGLCALLASRRRRSPPRLPAPSVARELLIPVVDNDPDLAARAAVLGRICELVAEDDWRGVAGQIAYWEGGLEATPGGRRYHDIALEGCLLGLHALLDEASADDLADLAPAEAEIARFGVRHEANPNDHILAALAARAHIAVGERCRSEYWPDGLKRAAWRRMAQHFIAADRILRNFEPLAFMSPVLGEAAYLVAEGMPDGDKRLRPAFEDWIDLDPSSPAIYARHALNLTPDRFGSIAELLEEADRAEDRTSETLGAGGYALFVLPLIEEGYGDHFSADRLATGLKDLAQLSGTQAEVNWAAATIASELDRREGEDAAPFRAAFDAIATGTLGVIYPRLWNEPLEAIRSRLAGSYARAADARVSTRLQPVDAPFRTRDRAAA